jgi:hypothetical protein
LVRLQVEPQLSISVYQGSAHVIRNSGVEPVIDLSIELAHFFLISTPSGWNCPRFDLSQPELASQSRLDVGAKWELDLQDLAQRTIAEAKEEIGRKVLIIYSTITVHRAVDRRKWSIGKEFIILPGVEPQRALVVDMEKYPLALRPDLPEDEVHKFLRLVTGRASN